jgi:hypothetical protein
MTIGPLIGGGGGMVCVGIGGWLITGPRPRAGVAVSLQALVDAKTKHHTAAYNTERGTNRALDIGNPAAITFTCVRS